MCVVARVCCVAAGVLGSGFIREMQRSEFYAEKAIGHNRIRCPHCHHNIDVDGFL